MVQPETYADCARGMTSFNGKPLSWPDLIAGYRRPVLLGCLLNLAGAISGLSVLVLFNRALNGAVVAGAYYVLFCVALVAASFVLGTASQRLIARTGHNIVEDLRLHLVRRVLATDVEHLDRLGGAPVLTCLTKDIATVSQAFNSLPFVLFGAIVLLCGYCYLFWLSLAYGIVLLCMMALVVALATMFSRRARSHKEVAREADDHIQTALGALVSGRNELALSRARRQSFMKREVQPAVGQARGAETMADLSNVMTANFVNAVILLFMLAILALAMSVETDAAGLGGRGTAVAAATTILFIRSPLAGLIGSLPNLAAGSVAIGRIGRLDLAPVPSRGEGAALTERPSVEDWSSLRVSNLTYSYPDAGGEPGFSFGPTDFHLRRGEIVFIIGGNGSGKSTFSRLLTGLYGAADGAVELDGRRIGPSERDWYREHFSVILSDFHLFSHLVEGEACRSDPEFVDELIQMFGLSAKVSVKAGCFDTLALSQGQRKRLALISILAEDRPILLLDEWAADQDPEFRRRFYVELLPRLQQKGKTIVAITHDDSFFGLADRVYHMNNGRMEEIAVTSGSIPEPVADRLFWTG